MNPRQDEWMKTHPEFKLWKPQGPVASLYDWADVGWIMPSGKFVPDGEHHHWGGVHTMSSGDTLYVMRGSGAVKIGRECMIV